MKRILCAVLCAMMVMLSAVSFAAVTYTLPEKMQKQLDIGSGLKGSFTLHGEGNHPYLLALQPFLDVELQFRGLRSGDEAHYYAYQAGEDEAQLGLTEAYDTGKGIFLRSDLLPGEVFSLPGLDAALDHYTQPEEGNPSLASAFLRWMNLSSAEREALLNPVTTKLSGELELWLAGYASVSAGRTLENGLSVIDLSYTIPMADLKQEMVSLMMTLISDENGQALLNKLLDEEQKKVFANENLAWYYGEALAALNHDYDLTYTRTVSTLGTPISSTLEMPLDENRTNYGALVIEDDGGLISFTLQGEERIITLMIGENLDLTQIDAFSAWIISRPSPTDETAEMGVRHALRLDVSRESTKSTDEESRDHERITWKAELQTDVSRLPEGENPDNYPEDTPVTLDLTLHYFSRYSQSSPTTLEIDGTFSMENLSLTMQGQMKTASPWIFSPFKAENATDITSLTRPQIVLKAAEFLAAAREQLKPAEKIEEEAQEETTAAAAPQEKEATSPEPQETVSPVPEKTEKTTAPEPQETEPTSTASEETETSSSAAQETETASPVPDETETAPADSAGA